MQPARDAADHDTTRRESSRLAQWLDAHEVERTGRAGPKRAVLTVALVYLLGFGMPVVAAVMIAAAGHDRARSGGSLGWTPLTTLELALNAAAVFVAIPLLMREAPSWAHPRLPGRRWITELKAFALGWLAIFVGSTAVKLLGWLPHPSLRGGWSGTPGIAAGLLAGPTEEIVVLVVPLVFLRAARWPWWAVLTAMLALRLAYHVYYGFPVAGFTLWAVAMILIYLRTHAAVGLILVHSFWDTTILLGGRWVAIPLVVVPVMLLALLSWGVVSLVLWLVHRSDRESAAREAAARASSSGIIGWHQNSAGHWWWWDGQRWIAPPPPPGTPVANGPGPHG